MVGTVVASNERYREVIHYFARNDPITRVFQFSVLDQEELLILVQLSRGKFVSENKTVSIFRKMFTLERLLQSFECRSKTNNKGQMLVALHPIICSLLLWIMDKQEKLFSISTRILIPFEPKETDNFSFYFPAFKTLIQVS